MSTYNSYYLNNTAGSNFFWFDQSMTLVKVNFLGTAVTFRNGFDQSLTVLHGEIGGFSIDAQGVLHGSIKWITRTEGINEYEAVGGVFEPLLIDATDFQSATPEQRYDLVFGRPMTYNGDAGNNMLSGNTQADVFNGFGGNDTVTYENSHAAVTIDLLGAGDAGDAISDVYNSIETFIATGFNDTMIGDGADSRLWGRDGNDVLIGGDGADLLVGDFGDDQLFGGGGGGDRLQGGPGNDVLDPGAGGDARLQGSNGNDTLVGGQGMFELLDAGADNDTATFAAKTTGVHVEIATIVNLTATGFATDAVGSQLFFDNLVDIENVIGGSGDDYISFGNLSLLPRGTNQIWGNAGDDFIEGGQGNDMIDGGSGFDIMSYIHFFGWEGIGINIVLGANGNGITPDFISSSYGMDTYFSIEGIEGSNFNDALTGNSRSNKLIGQGGNDILNGGMGSDQLHGGDGFDTLNYSQTINRGITLTMFAPGEGTAVTRPNKITETDTFTGIEKVIGTAFDDTIYGHDGNEVFEAGSGNDTMLGGNGNDTLTGAGGNDSLTGDGDWSFQGGSEISGDDTLSGGDGNDMFNAGNGNNSIIGGTGRDTLDYSWLADDFGNVEYWIEANLTTGIVTRKFFDFFDTYVHGTDTIVDASTFDNVTGTIMGDTITGNGMANILLGFDGNDVIAANSGADTIDGGLGNDTLSGGNGSDVLIGSAGNDTLTGGGNRDLFRLTTPGDGIDQITDFNSAADDIQIVGAAFGNLPAGQSVASIFVTGTEPAVIDFPTIRFYFETDTSTLWYDSNGSGRGGAVALLTVQSGAVVTAADILVI